MNRKEMQQRIAELESLVQGSRAQCMDIVYPHVEQFAQWEELRYSLRSLEKNLRYERYRVWIVGDKPGWLSGEASHIPVEYTGQTPRIDILHKHMAVWEHPGIGEEYIWMNDDIYLVNPVQYADLCLNVAVNDLRQTYRQYNERTTWGRDVLRTYRLLQENGLPVWNYACHIPHRYEKQKVRQLVEQFGMLEDPIELTLLYYNHYFRDFYPYWDTLSPMNNQGFCINRPDPDMENLRRQMGVKKYMNNSESGMAPWLQEFLQSLFPLPSRFEAG